MSLREAISPRRHWSRIRYERLLRRMAGPQLIAAFANAYESVFFVEIGANDGHQHDHLRPFVLSRGWSGIMVEPVPYVFERLQANYGAIERVRLENAAIADHDGTLPFYHLAQAGSGEELPPWYDGIGSFSREKVLGHVSRIPDVESRLVCTQVATLTFDSLLRRHGDPRVDLMVIDTEGHEWEVIRHVDFASHMPRLVVYEHFHLSPPDRSACRRQLEAVGYETKEEGFDTFCLDPHPEDGLTRCWRSIPPAIPGVSVYDEPS